MNLAGEAQSWDTEGETFMAWQSGGKLSGISTGRGRVPGESPLNVGHQRGNARISGLISQVKRTGETAGWLFSLFFYI